MIAPSEKHLEDWLFEDITRLGQPSSESLYENGVVYRQLEMRRGIADLLFVDNESMTIVELKKGEINDSALQQVLRYMGDLKDTWEETVHIVRSRNDNPLFTSFPTYGGLDIRGILIGHYSNENTLAAAHGADIWTFKYEYDESAGYGLDWLFSSG